MIDLSYKSRISKYGVFYKELNKFLFISVFNCGGFIKVAYIELLIVSEVVCCTEVFLFLFFYLLKWKIFGILYM